MGKLKENLIVAGAIAILYGAGAGIEKLGNSIAGYENVPIERVIPNTQVQQGYVQPSKLEISAQDLVGNRKKETVLEYDGQKYLFTLDSEGVPQVENYSIEPAKIIRK